jgi:hypothetical protein
MQIKAVARVLHTTKQMSSYIGTWAWLRQLTTIHVMCNGQGAKQADKRTRAAKRTNDQKGRRPKGQPEAATG